MRCIASAEGNVSPFPACDNRLARPDYLSSGQAVPCSRPLHCQHTADWRAGGHRRAHRRTCGSRLPHRRHGRGWTGRATRAHRGLFTFTRSARFVALNVGGIANVTVIPAGASPDQVIAFDTGPGNMIIDALSSHFSGGRQSCDRDGRIAASGHVDRKLLRELLGPGYFRQPPPKSAGREEYGKEFVAALLRRGLASQDLIATATAFTAASIAAAIRRFGTSDGSTPGVKKARSTGTSAGRLPDEIIVSGGGLRNPAVDRAACSLHPGSSTAHLTRFRH